MFTVVNIPSPAYAMAVNSQNSGPVSVDYTSRDEAVPISFL